MSQASETELYMLELINSERTSRGLEPLTINSDLNEASEDHSTWMLENTVFSHTGAGGSSATQRIDDAGYPLSGSWRTAENIAWQSERGAEGITDDVADLHEALMNSPGHRANLLNPDLEHIGIGIETGRFNGYEAVMVTQNFGATDAETPDQDQPEARVTTRELPDGRVSTTTWLDGTRSEMVVTDTRDAFVWSRVERSYDATGELAQKVIQYDDGRQRDATYADGTLQTVTMTDTGDQYAWQSFQDRYAPSGERLSREIIYDDGRERVIDYTDSLDGF